jgi:DNA-binding transcriptional MerR regulator
MTVPGGRMRIGEVHALLRQDYPDIELSKIRYYEDKGLVEPIRSRKGYRLYSERDVACLREAIRLAQEEFVPLKVVRLRLVEQGLLTERPAVAPRHAAREALAPGVTATAPTPRALSVVPDEPDGASIPSAVMIQLDALGLLERPRDAAVARAAAALLARGVDPRQIGALRRVVEREAGVIEDVTEPLRSPARRLSREQVRDAVRAVADEVEGLRRLMLDAALADQVGD